MFPVNLSIAVEMCRGQLITYLLAASQQIQLRSQSSLRPMRSCS
uniref:Uncharacterized protein n=1 Tax=Anguilla anguilla TaxID=7936 RepID=A0A0E9TFC4_ANGAN